VIVQVVPVWNPEEEGVSAYARAVGRCLEKCSGDFSESAAGGARSTGEIHLDWSNIRERDRWLGPEMRRSARAILLHFSGYGFQSRGVPFDLVRRLERFRALDSDTSVGVMFHEVAASGPPWRSSFWLRPLQRRVASRILRLSDLAVTSLERYRVLLRSLDPGRSVDVVGIPSTIGEPEMVSEFGAREERLVVFGSSDVRARAWGPHRNDLATAAKALGVREIVDVGLDVGAPDLLEGVRVVRWGIAKAPAVSDLLASARGGFLAYPPDFLGKSTTYAAYAAHGVVPVCAWRGKEARPARCEEPWTTANCLGDPAQVARRAREHYGTRNLKRHSEVWRRLLEER